MHLLHDYALGYIIPFGFHHLPWWDRVGQLLHLLGCSLWSDLGTWPFLVMLVFPWLRRSWRRPGIYFVLSTLGIQLVLLLPLIPYNMADRCHLSINEIGGITLLCAIPLGILWAWAIAKERKFHNADF